MDAHSLCIVLGEVLSEAKITGGGQRGVPASLIRGMKTARGVELFFCCCFFLFFLSRGRRKYNYDARWRDMSTLVFELYSSAARVLYLAVFGMQYPLR